MKKYFIKFNRLLRKLKDKGLAHLFGSSVINKVLGFLSSIILVRLISKTDYGVYSNADNILGMFCLLEGFGMVSSFLQFGCTTEGQKKEEVWSFCFWFSLVFQLILSCIIALTAITVDFNMAGTGPMLLLMSFLPIPRLIRDMQQVYLRTELKNKDYAYSNTFSTIATLVLSCGLSVFFFTKGMIAANYLAAIITIFFILLYSKVHFPSIKNHLSKDEKRKIIRFSTVCLINNSTSSIMYLLDTFVLGIIVASSTVTASYKVAAKIPTALALIPACVMTFIYPYFAKNKDDGKWCFKNYKRVISMFGVFNAVLVCFLVLLAPAIIKIFFGEQYLDALVPFRLLCLNYLIQASFGTISGQLLVSQEKLWFNTMTGFVSSGMNTALNLVLIPIYSSMGAAIATVAVTTIVSFMKATYLYLLLKKKSK